MQLLISARDKIAKKTTLCESKGIMSLLNVCCLWTQKTGRQNGCLWNNLRGILAFPKHD